VALNGRDPERLARAERLVGDAARAPIVGIAADVSVPDQAVRLVADVEAEFGRLDILVANAGGPPAGRATELADADWQRALDLNLLSTVTLCRAALPGMRARRWGRVLCLTSVAAKQPLGDLVLSTTARAGVLGFAKCLADEVAADGITVNVLCPGYMSTQRSIELMERRARETGATTEAVTERLTASIPARRMGAPAELGGVATFLASEQAAYVTGAVIQVDGGLIRSII
jgi:3-oxoacyl-[acyl-carrier protein] reductase